MATKQAIVRQFARQTGIIPLLKPSHSLVSFAFLPEGDDPDTYIMENGRTL